MNALITINYNDYMVNNARDSFTNACSRWKCDYIEITDISYKYLHPCFSKIKLLTPFTQYDRILYIDSDILIRSDAPNIFHLHGLDNFLCVKDISPRYDLHYVKELIDDIQMRYYDYLNSKIGGVSLENYTSGFFNGGFLCFNPSRCKNLFDIFNKNTPTEEDFFKDKIEISGNRYGQSHHEQAMLNYCAQKTIKDDILYMSDDWNCINPPVHEASMKYFIYHFTGRNHLELKRILKTYQWRVS